MKDESRAEGGAMPRTPRKRKLRPGLYYDLASLLLIRDMLSYRPLSGRTTP